MQVGPNLCQYSQVTLRGKELIHGSLVKSFIQSRTSMFIFASSAIAIGTLPVAGLYHDWADLQDGRVDAVLHVFLDRRVLLSLIYLAPILGLLWHLAEAIGANRTRAKIAMSIWIGLGFLAVFLAAMGSDFLQSEYNTNAYKRLTPDDYLYWIGPRENSSPEVLSILFRPNAFDHYSWARMTITELVFMVLMAAAAAWSLYYSHNKGPIRKAISVPVSLLIVLNLYVWIFAPWAFASDYDYFVGDRVLGAMANSLFIAHVDDPTAGITMLAYVISIVGMIICWRSKSTDDQSE